MEKLTNLEKLWMFNQNILDLQGVGWGECSSGIYLGVFVFSHAEGQEAGYCSLIIWGGG